MTKKETSSTPIKQEKKIMKNKLKEYRKRYGFSQEYIAKKLGKSQQQISKIENSITDLSSADIKMYLSMFQNISYDELFNTDRLSIVINNSNKELLEKYIEEKIDLLPGNITEYDKLNITVNYIIRMYLEGNSLRDVETYSKSEVKAPKDEL